MKAPTKIPEKTIGFYRGIVAKVKSKTKEDVKETLAASHVNLQWFTISSEIDYAIISIPANFEEGSFTPKVKQFASPDFKKLLTRGFKPPYGIEPRNQNFDAFLIHQKSTPSGAFYLVSIGPPIVGAALNTLLNKKIEFLYKKIDLRGFCEYLFKNPDFSDMVVNRLNFELSGRENPNSVQRSSVNGIDVFRSSFFCDLIGMRGEDLRSDFNPFTKTLGEKRSLWELEPTSCKVRLRTDPKSPFWINFDRYGNFLFYFKSENDFVSLTKTLSLIENISNLRDCGNPLKREDEKLEE